MNTQRMYRQVLSFLLLAAIAVTVLLGLFAALSKGPVSVTGQAALLTVTPGSTAWYDSLPPTKRAEVVKQEATRVAAMTAFPLRTPDPRVTPVLPTSAPTVLVDLPRRRAGAGTIVEIGQAPFSPMQYRIENQWYAEVNNEVIIAFAGLQREPHEMPQDNLGQGVVVVAGRSSDAASFTRPTRTFLTPTKAGPLRIVDADGMTLKLTTPDGTVYLLDTLAAVNPGFVTPVIPPTATPLVAPVGPPYIIPTAAYPAPTLGPLPTRLPRP